MNIFKEAHQKFRDDYEEADYGDYFDPRKKEIIENIIDRTGVYSPDSGYFIKLKNGAILDNMEATRFQLRNAIAIEDWNYESNGKWGKW